jgi:serine/threonine-protein kinase
MFVIVVLIGGLIAYGLTQRQSAPHARSTPSPSAVASPGRSAPATVLVNASSYIGQPYNAVAAALTGEHLVVHRVNMASATAVPGTVLGVNPSGPVAVGGTVNVTVAVPAPSPSPKHKKKHGHG